MATCSSLPSASPGALATDAVVTCSGGGCSGGGGSGSDDGEDGDNGDDGCGCGGGGRQEAAEAVEAHLGPGFFRERLATDATSAPSYSARAAPEKNGAEMINCPGPQGQSYPSYRQRRSSHDVDSPQTDRVAAGGEMANCVNFSLV